jgi:glutathione S-transferase
MSITFYYLSGSPFSWKVWLALEHKQLAYDLRVLSADAGDLKKPELTVINPRGKVPAILDGGFGLYESSAILEYLEDEYPLAGKPLWPQEIRLRAHARRIAAESDSYVYPHVRRLVLELGERREGRPGATTIEEAKSALVREFALVERSFRGPFAAGSEPSGADFALYPLTAILKRLDARQRDHAIVDVIPDAIRQWMSHVEALPFFARTTPPHWRPA